MRISRTFLWRVAASGGLIGAVAACGEVAAVAPTTAAQPSHVAIPSADRFSPFITVVRQGSQVTFHNGDADAHSVVSVPGSPEPFSKRLQPGETWTLTLQLAGSYRYYCSIHAEYDAATGQVRALPRADHPDEPMEGVIIVST